MFTMGCRREGDYEYKQGVEWKCLPESRDRPKGCELRSVVLTIDAIFQCRLDL